MMNLKIRQSKFSQYHAIRLNIHRDDILKLPSTTLDVLNAYIAMLANCITWRLGKAAWGQTKLGLWAGDYVRQTVGRHQAILIQAQALVIKSGKDQHCTNVVTYNPSFFQESFLRSISKVCPAALLLLALIVPLLNDNLLKINLCSVSTKYNGGLQGGEMSIFDTHSSTKFRISDYPYQDKRSSLSVDKDAPMRNASLGNLKREEASSASNLRAVAEEGTPPSAPEKEPSPLQKYFLEKIKYFLTDEYKAECAKRRVVYNIVNDKCVSNTKTQGKEERAPQVKKTTKEDRYWAQMENFATADKNPSLRTWSFIQARWIKEPFDPSEWVEDLSPQKFVMDERVIAIIDQYYPKRKL